MTTLAVYQEYIRALSTLYYLYFNQLFIDFLKLFIFASHLSNGLALVAWLIGLRS